MSILPSEAKRHSPPPAVDPMERARQEEVANTITHALGFFLSLPAGAYLMYRALQTGDAWHIAGCAIYSVTMLGVYLASTLSHCVHEVGWKHWCRQLDQAAIYLFIAGTFTPFAFDYLRDGWWVVITVLVWGIALSGCFAKLFLSHRIHGVEIPVYVMLGWLPIFGAPHVAHFCSPNVLWWMLAGGLCYTIGTWFLKNDHRAWWIHSIWHLLVIAGTALHYAAIVLFVRPI
ncbi:MAG TPA: hemolysin III family protein [Pirellulaceae bacterium]|nr:hemolysin III family protein [Pirellulaceae bacterium]